MKNDAKRVAPSRSQPADAMPHVDPVVAARAFYRPVAHSKDHPVTTFERNHVHPRLHPRPLLSKHELAPREIAIRRLEQKRNLQREHMLSVDILVQTVVVALAVFEQQWRGLSLTRLVTSFE